MKKMIMLAAAAAMAFAFSSCDDNTEGCWEVTQTASSFGVKSSDVIGYFWGTKSEAKDATGKGVSVLGASVKYEYKKASDTKCPSQDGWDYTSYYYDYDY